MLQNNTIQTNKELDSSNQEHGDWIVSVLTGLDGLLIAAAQHKSSERIGTSKQLVLVSMLIL